MHRHPWEIPGPGRSVADGTCYIAGSWAWLEARPAKWPCGSAKTPCVCVWGGGAGFKPCLKSFPAEDRTQPPCSPWSPTQDRPCQPPASLLVLPPVLRVLATACFWNSQSPFLPEAPPTYSPLCLKDLLASARSQL